jgi:lipopolysaccharide transport system permease protein
MQNTAAVLRSDASSTGTTRRPTVVVEPHKGLLQLDLGEIWQYRGLLYLLVWRDVKVRYKQTVIGTAWVALQPLLMMVILTVVFGRLAGVPSDGRPYPVFAFAALLPWTYFSQVISLSGPSLVINSALITKVYFPRLIVPLATTITPIIDLGVAFVILVGLMLWYGMAPTWGVLLLPLFLLLALITALAVSLFLTALNVRYRDVGHTIPFVVQAWMYASPVAYPVSLVPEPWRLWYSLNPMVGVIEGFRWALLGSQTPDITAMVVSAVVMVVLLIASLVYFKQMERTFADVV